MAANTSAAQLNGFLKPIFGELQKAYTEMSVLQKRIPYKKDELVGKYMTEPIVVRPSWGLTYCGSAADVQTLSTPISLQTEEAQVQPFLIVLRNQLSYGVLDRGQGGETSFQKMAVLAATQMNTDIRNGTELSIMHGQEGIGTMGANVSGQVMTISDATFAPGVFSILEGAVVDVYQSDLATLRQGSLAVTAVDLDAKTITVTGTVTGIVTGDVMFLKSANASGTFAEMVGIGKQLNATTGTVFNINKANFSLWRASRLTSAGQAGAGLLTKAAAKAVGRGYQGKLLAVVSPAFFNVLNNNNMALRELDSSYKSSKTENGSDALSYHTQGVTIEVVVHPMQKDGQAYMLPEPYCKRIGSLEEEVTFKVPGANDDSPFLLPVLGSTAVETQCRTDQAVFIERPAFAVLISGITYS